MSPMSVHSTHIQLKRNLVNSLNLKLHQHMTRRKCRRILKSEGKGSGEDNALFRDDRWWIRHSNCDNAGCSREQRNVSDLMGTNGFVEFAICYCPNFGVCPPAFVLLGCWQKSRKMELCCTKRVQLVSSQSNRLSWVYL